jgi:hypothetical protein
MELVEDVEDVAEKKDATEMTIADIIQEVEACGRGKRRRVRSNKYADFEEH